MHRSLADSTNPGGVEMLPSIDKNNSAGIYPQLSNSERTRMSNNRTFDDQDEAHLFSSPNDLESPGNISQGQFSLGMESTFSGQSDHSRVGLLKKENTEKEVIIDQKMTVYDDDDDDEDMNACRIGRFSPKCFLLCANVKMFVVFMCLLIVVASALTTGYLNSVITTIEKRFEIGSSVSGLVAAAYEFGSLVSVIFVSFLGASRHIPKWIGLGVFIMGTGSLLFSLPHIIAPKYTVGSGMTDNSTGEENICRGSGQNLDDEMCFEENSGNWGYVLILVASQILIGTGGTPIMTLGVTYVDNHVAKEKSPAYLACLHASGALGPVLGYALGALLLRYYVDTFSHDVSLTLSSPRWIGAWWGGFIICGLLLMLLSLPFLAYPRVLVKEKRRILETKTKESLLLPPSVVDDDVAEDRHYGRSIKEIPKAVFHLLKNPVYAVLLPAICCEICIVSGFVIFLPKYLESQFGVSTSMANLFTGGIGIPGAVIGILMGGYIMKRLALSPKGAIQFVIILNTLALSGFSFFFYMGCDNLKIAGANFPYFNSSGHKIFEANLTSTCNQNCACSPNHIQPICGINGITYFSPCHAGCTLSNYFYDPGKEEKSFNYSGCSCISDRPVAYSSHEVIISPMATSGACKNTCERLLPFLILLVGMTFCVAGTQMPLLMVTLRSVGTMERSFALGLQFVAMRLFAYIPSPIFFGNVIDSACVLWSVKCERNGSCILYDIVTFRYKYVGIGAGLKVISLCIFIAVWYLIRRRTRIQLAAAAAATDKSEAPAVTTASADRERDARQEQKVLNEEAAATHRPSHLPLRSPSHHGADQGQGSQEPAVQGGSGVGGHQDQNLGHLSLSEPPEAAVVNSNMSRGTNIPRDESVL